MTYEEFLIKYPDISYVNTGAPTKEHWGFYQSLLALREKNEEKAVEIMNRQFDSPISSGKTQEPKGKG